MFEVAKLAGVSHQTVSRVINDSPDVSDATRARVQAAIDQLGYRPSNSARALASRRSRPIGLIAGGLKYFGPISSISSGVSSSPRTDRATNSAVCSMAGIGGVPASSSICLAWVVSLMLLRSSPSSMQGTSPLAISLASAELARSASCSLMISNATVLYASNVPFIVLSVSSLFPCLSMFPVGNI